MLPGDIEIRVMHVPAVSDNLKWSAEEQIERKKEMLLMESDLEKKEIRRGATVISCGDFNTEPGNLECHEIFDGLCYDKLLNEPTWNNRALDNVLVSPFLKGRVTSYAQNYRLGVTSDHKTIVFTVKNK